jgi:transcriptional regulator with XRE-family HTH domain
MRSGFREQIKKIREEHKLTQNDVAEKIGLSRLTYINIETGDKSPTYDQLSRIAEALAINLQELLFPTELHKQRQRYNIAKYRQMCLACIHYGSDRLTHRITKIKLSQLLYLIDFSWYRQTSDSMSGMPYYHYPRGPVTNAFYRVIDSLFDNGQIIVEIKGAAFMIMPNENSFHSELRQREIAHIEVVCSKWLQADTQSIIEFTHAQAPWLRTKSGALIPYEYANDIPEDKLY